MENNYLNTTQFISGRIHGGFVLRSPAAPENGNMALHVCYRFDDALAARKLLAKQTLPLDHWVLANQKHTGRICRVGSDHRGSGAFDAGSAIGPCDALYTTQPDTLIGVFTADCLGILLCDPSVPMICAVHSGWKGTAQAILLNALQTLQTQGLLHPDTIEVRFSPSLQKSSLEVGPEVVEAIRQMAAAHALDLTGCIEDGTGDRSYIDNQEINVRMLEAFGITENHIFRSSRDTKTDPDCFSYRRDGRLGGEHFSWLYIGDPL